MAFHVEYRFGQQESDFASVFELIEGLFEEKREAFLGRNRVVFLVKNDRAPRRIADDERRGLRVLRVFRDLRVLRG